MDLQSIDDLESKHTTPKLARRHLKALENELKWAEGDEETIFDEQRGVHTHESLVYCYYRKLHVPKKENTFYGYLPVIKSAIEYDTATIPGTIFALHEDPVFKYFTNDKSIRLNGIKEVNEFYPFLLRTPTPFIFLPVCDLREFHGLMRELYGQEFSLSILHGKTDSHTIVFMEPFLASKLGLDFLINDIIRDRKIFLLLLGFICANKV
jgi:hypothetical protein